MLMDRSVFHAGRWVPNPKLTNTPQLVMLLSLLRCWRWADDLLVIELAEPYVPILVHYSTPCFIFLLHNRVIVFFQFSYPNQSPIISTSRLREKSQITILSDLSMPSEFCLLPSPEFSLDSLCTHSIRWPLDLLTY